MGIPRRARTASVAALLLAVVLPLLSSPAGRASVPVACPVDDGRERLTLAGERLAFEAPAVFTPEFQVTRDVTGDTVTPYRTATFPYAADFAPAAAATVRVTLGWVTPSDYDVYVLAPDGSVLARSDELNAADGTTREQLDVDLDHCAQFTVVVRNWAGAPHQPLTLELAATPGEELLSCAPEDPAPGCAGKEAGAQPDLVPDRRPRLYLGGDPGQVSMVHAYQGNGAPFRGTLAPSRPTTGTPNSYTRPIVGFREQYQNPFVPHFTGELEQPRPLQGKASALLWVMSRTADATSTLYVDLYADGSLLSSVPVRGDAIGPNPTPVAVDFGTLDLEEAASVTVQVATQPAASSAGAGNPADAHVTLLYGSVQFPSRLTLPA